MYWRLKKIIFAVGLAVLLFAMVALFFPEGSLAQIICIILSILCFLTTIILSIIRR